MSLWKPVTSEPITTEKSVRVYNTETPQVEGYASISWALSGNVRYPRFYGWVRDFEGAVLDEKPTFRP